MKVKYKLISYIPQAWRDKFIIYKINRNKKMSYKKAEKKINDTYYSVFNRNIMWNEPATYTEKVNITKIYDYSELKTKLSDKIAVREWVEEKIGKKYLVPILGVYDRFEDIDFEILPDQFVIKCSHDSGSSNIISSWKKINETEKNKLKRRYNDFFLRREYAYLTFELHYRDIKPQIIIEKYLGKNVNDYKFLCFNGTPYFCWVDFNRFGEHKRNVYDLEWKLQPFNQATYDNYDEDCKKPNNFDEMYSIVSVLCQGFSHVRVDLYDIDGHIYFGEMTFTNGTGLEIITPEEWDYKLGKLWKVDIQNIQQFRENNSEHWICDTECTFFKKSKYLGESIGR